MGDNNGAFVDQDLALGQLLGRFLNPDAAEASKAATTAGTPAAAPPAAPAAAATPARPAAPPAPDPRLAVPAGEPPNPTLRTRPAAPAPNLAAPTPAATPAPAANGSAAPAAPKSWADYVRAANDASMHSLGTAQAADDQLRAEPSAVQQNAPLVQQEAALRQPLDPSQYKPGIGTRIARGVAGWAKGGIAGALDPGNVGATPYGAPTRQMGIAQARNTAQADALKAQEERNVANIKADSDRLKDIGTEQRGEATGFQDVSKSATAQQAAEQKADYNQQLEDTKKQLADVRQQIADQGGKPKTFEQAVIASNDPTLSPSERQQYAAAAKTIAATEIRKFRYANKSTGDNDERRQSMIDAATEQVKALQDRYVYNWRRNQYENPNQPNDILNPSEYTDKKNEIASKLDKDLTAKKLQPLRVRFNPSDAGGGKPTGRAARQAQAAANNPQQPTTVQAATRRPAPPTPTGPAPQGAVDMALGSDGQYHYRDGGKRDLGVVK